MAETAYSALYDSNNLPTGGRPFNPPFGIAIDYVNEEIATTELDTANDVTYLIPVPVGRTIVKIEVKNEELDTGGGNALDLDIVLRTTDSAGTNTDTILYNAGTAFSAAVTTPTVVYPNAKVPASATGIGHIIAKVNVAATTAAAGDITLFAMWR